MENFNLGKCLKIKNDILSQIEDMNIDKNEILLFLDKKHIKLGDQHIKIHEFNGNSLLISDSNETNLYLHKHYNVKHFILFTNSAAFVVITNPIKIVNHNVEQHKNSIYNRHYKKITINNKYSASEKYHINDLGIYNDIEPEYIDCLYSSENMLLKKLVSLDDLQISKPQLLDTDKTKPYNKNNKHTIYTPITDLEIIFNPSKHSCNDKFCTINNKLMCYKNSNYLDSINSLLNTTSVRNYNNLSENSSLEEIPF